MEMNESLVMEMRVAVGTIATISEIADKLQTETQKKSLKAARELISTNYNYLFEALTNEFFESVTSNKDTLNEMLQEYMEMLDDPATKPPDIKQNAHLTNLEDVSERLYKAQTTISGVLEEIMPRYRKWENYRKQAENVMKALLQSNNEWKSKAVYQVFEPVEVTKIFADFSECVMAYELRLKSLEEAYKTMSRLVSIKLGTPSNPLTRTGSPASSRF
jgi:hypothetical protein